MLKIETGLETRALKVVIYGAELKDVESKIAFDKEITNLRELEISDIEKVKLSESDFADTSKIPTPYELIALESVIEFLEE